METQTTVTKNNVTKKSNKIAFVALITLLLLIPLLMIEGLIKNREDTNREAILEIEKSYSGTQTIYAPRLYSSEIANYVNDSIIVSNNIIRTNCTTLNYDANVTTDVLHRSIYDIIVYNSIIDIKGALRISDNMLNARKNLFEINISDFKGLTALPVLRIGEDTYKLNKKGSGENKSLASAIKIPQGAKVGELMDFSISIEVKGSEEIYFQASGEETTLKIASPYPHPAFKGNFLPESRKVGEDGFEASWRVLDLNINTPSTYMGVEFVDPANSYQQSMRSAKYGIVIIIMVFIAGLFAEFITKKDIHTVQYLIMGISLVLFYSLLLSFSEFIPFAASYIIATLMTVSALTLYFRAILKHKSAYVLGLFVALVYIVNYMLIQMETYALITGSLLLFMLLCVVMYLTVGINNEITKE